MREFILKHASIILVVALTIYSPIELTRLIIWQMGDPRFISYRTMQMFEIPFIWVLYLAAMALVYKMSTKLGAVDPWGN